MRWLCTMWFATFGWVSVCLASDTITVGIAGVTAGQVARVPVYIRDVAGTALGMDQEARIQSIYFRVLFNNPQLIEGCKTTQFPDCQITFVPAGVLTGLTPAEQTLSVGATSMAVRYLFNPATSPIPFSLNKTAPGDLIGYIEAKVVESVVQGDRINVEFDPEAESTSLSDSDGVPTEVVGSGLLLFGGTITVSECTTAPNAADVTFTTSGGGTAGVPINFQAVASNGYTFHDCDTVTWHFAGQGSATGLTATHTFASAGTFAVAMTVENPSGSVTITRQIVVTPELGSCSPPPSSSNLSMTLSGGCGTASSPCQVSTPITFTAVAFGYTFQACDTVRWSFSDDTNFIGNSITKTFTQSGSANVTMTLSNASGNVSITRGITIGNGGSESCTSAPPEDKISIGWSGACSSTASCSKGAPITFSPVVSDFTFRLCDRFEWNFGDGTATSFQKNPTHTFSASGAFTVTLRVFNSIGSVTLNQNFMISAAAGVPCNCVADGPRTWPSSRFAEFLVAVSDCEPFRYEWRFGDNSSKTTTLVPVTAHVYAFPGTYQWTVDVISLDSPSCHVGGTIVIQSDVKRRAVRK
ncbi:MAG: PKD domain-containing protein [Thermoanaerobaculia bacterium]